MTPEQNGFETAAEAKVTITGTLVFRDAEGNIVGETQMQGTVNMSEGTEDGNVGE